MDHHFTVDDLLDFTNEEDDPVVADDVFLDSAESSTLTAGELYLPPPQFSCNLTADSYFSTAAAAAADICAPCDDLEELEWLSNFVEESFSSNDIPEELHVITQQEKVTQISGELDDLLRREVVVPAARARRSKRSRAAFCDWSSRTLLPESPPEEEGGKSEGGRRCMHCATEKTPQWRTGPMGAKTLCNACGVRFKSGRLVPEYRPAASPTFISTQHSNSHRKVVELRRLKEFESVRRREQHIFSNTGFSALYRVSDGRDYFIQHRNGGSDFRQLY